MIDNIILLITGTLHERTITELIPKCHPLGSFEEMASINIASTPVELYNAVLVDTPLGKLKWSMVEMVIEVKTLFSDKLFLIQMQCHKILIDSPSTLFSVNVSTCFLMLENTRKHQ